MWKGGPVNALWGSSCQHRVQVWAGQSSSSWIQRRVRVAKIWTQLSNFHFHIINSTDRVGIPAPGLLLQTWLGLWLPWLGTGVWRSRDLSVGNLCGRTDKQVLPVLYFILFVSGLQNYLTFFSLMMVQVLCKLPRVQTYIYWPSI